MGTISEKLTYLNGTKQAIKDELNRFGADLDNEDTFRSYSNVLNDIYDKLPKVSGNGSDFSLENAQNGKLDSFGMDGNTEQTTYSGKNLISKQITSTTKKGVTITNNGNGTYTLNGKATDNVSFDIYASDLNLPTGEYVLSGCPSGGSASTYKIAWNVGDVTNNDFGNGSSYNGSANNRSVWITIYNNYQCNNLIFKPMIEKGSTATEYEPYVGGTPSPNPDYPQDVKVVENEQVINVTGKNLFDKDSANIIDNKYLNASGVEVNDNAFAISDYIQIQSNQTYSLTPRINVSACLCYYDTNKNFISSVSLSNINNTFVTPANSCYIKNSFKKDVANSIQIELGNQATTYEPYQSQDYEIDLLDYELCKIEDYQDVIFKNNQLSEYYDSTLDEDSWYIKKEIGKVVLDGSEDWLYSSSTTNYYFYLSYVGQTKPYLPSSIVMSDYYKYTNNLGNVYDYAITGGNNYFPLIKNKDITSVEDFKTWLSTHNTTVYYILATPTYEKITNSTLISQLESIEAFTGLNNFSVSNENNVLPTLYVSRLKELGKLE